MHCVEMDNFAILSTQVIAELINKVFELESHSLVLECKELEEALRNDRSTSHSLQ